MVSDDVIKAVAFVKRGKNKQAILLCMQDYMMPSDIVLKVFGKKSEIAYSVVSRALSDLESEDLVEILNPDERTGRMYKLTKKGESVREFLLKKQDATSKKLILR